MTINTYPTVAVRVDPKVAQDIETVAADRFNNKTSTAIRALLRVGLEYYRNYDEIHTEGQETFAAKRITAAEAKLHMTQWQQTMPADQFKELAHLMTIMHETRYDEKTELRQEIARLKGGKK